MSDLQVGDEAPDFSLPASTGEIVALQNYRGKKRVVLFFYPDDDTPTCTEQACSFRDSTPEILEKDTVVFGISPDNLKSHGKFVKKYGLNYPLLADEDLAVANAYGVWGEKTLFGRTYMGILRKTFLIGKDGRIEHILYKVKASTHGQEILKLLQG